MATQAALAAPWHGVKPPALVARGASWRDVEAAYLLGGLAETMTARLRDDLPIPRDELIERSADLFTVVAEHAVGGSERPHGGSSYS